MRLKFLFFSMHFPHHIKLFWRIYAHTHLRHDDVFNTSANGKSPTIWLLFTFLSIFLSHVFHSNTAVVFELSSLHSKMNKLARTLKIGCIQLLVGANKTENVARALEKIREAKMRGAELIALPECFNSPYGTSFFPQYAESIPDGETSKLLSGNKS